MKLMFNLFLGDSVAPNKENVNSNSKISKFLNIRLNTFKCLKKLIIADLSVSHKILNFKIAKFNQKNILLCKRGGAGG